MKFSRSDSYSLDPLAIALDLSRAMDDRIVYFHLNSGDLAFFVIDAANAVIPRAWVDRAGCRLRLPTEGLCPNDGSVIQFPYRIDLASFPGVTPGDLVGLARAWADAYLERRLPNIT